MSLRVRTTLFAVASILVSLPVYIFLHEGGHALVAVLCGARITKFSVLGAYTTYEGGTFTAVTLSLTNIAGMLLPVLVAVAYMLTYRDNIKSTRYRICSYLFLIAPVCSVLSWILVPILYLAGKAPQKDDVSKFIHNSGISPWVVMLGATVIFCGCVFIAWKKRIIQNYWAVIKGLKEDN